MLHSVKLIKYYYLVMDTATLIKVSKEKCPKSSYSNRYCAGKKHSQLYSNHIINYYL